jgi:hypothetical protein
VTLTASASDSDGTIASYEWDFDGNGTYDATTSASPASFVYTVAGTYTPRVRVIDNLGGTAAAAASTTLTVSAGSGGGKSPQSSDGGGAGGGGGCFIATAAYGSYLDPHVMVLRKFRDGYLMTSRPGRAFVELYYRASPQIADYIARHEGRKVAVRAALTPVVYGLEYPLVSSGLIMLVIGGVVVVVSRGSKKARS